MNLKELYLTIATVRHEPRLLREAFSPDVVSGKKSVKLPKHCWRDAVLRVVWPKQLPKALQNHYCPLFWVSNVFPILWAWVFVKFCVKSFRNTCNSLSEKLQEMNSTRYEEIYRKRDKERALKFFEKIETLTPSLVYNSIFFYGEDCCFSLIPEKCTEDDIHSGCLIDREWDYISDWYDDCVHVSYKLKEIYGLEWKSKAVELANEHLKVLKKEAEKEKERIAIKKQIKNVVTLNFKEALKDNTKAQETLQRMKESRQIAKITEMSNAIFKYGFIGMSFFLAVAVAVFTYKSIGTVVEVLEWCLDLVVTVLALIYLEIYSILTIFGMVGFIVLAVWLLVKLMVFLCETKRGRDFSKVLSEKIKLMTKPIWWPIIKGAELIVDLFELACNIVKMTYNENCPAIEREDSEK